MKHDDKVVLDWIVNTGITAAASTGVVFAVGACPLLGIPLLIIFCIWLFKYAFKETNNNNNNNEQ